MAMKKAIKKKWIKMLRSGKYEQATGTLRSQSKTGAAESYCCLGVLAIAVGLKKSKSYHNGFIWKRRIAGGAFNDSFLEHVGLSSSEQRKFVHMNDSQGKSFKEIADYAEANV